MFQEDLVIDKDMIRREKKNVKKKIQEEKNLGEKITTLFFNGRKYKTIFIEKLGKMHRREKDEAYIINRVRKCSFRSP